MGKDLLSVCNEILLAARRIPARMLEPLKAWTCQFAVTVTYTIAKVGCCLRII